MMELNFNQVVHLNWTPSWMFSFSVEHLRVAASKSFGNLYLGLSLASVDYPLL